MITLLEEILSLVVLILTAYSAYINSRVSTTYVTKEDFKKALEEIINNQENSSEQHKKIFKEINVIHHEIDHLNNNVTQQGLNVENRIKEIEKDLKTNQ